MEKFDDIFMVTDFMDSDLRRIIKSRERIQDERVRSYMAQLLASLHHVHCHSGIHRDLKPANILVSPQAISPATPYGLLRLCDFGLARVDATAANETKREQDACTEQDDEMEDAEESAPIEPGSSETEAAPRSPPMLKKQMTHYVVTRWYRAPEVILRQRYTAAIDLWAVGCIFKELLELTPASKFRTGALFPGRYCIPFSFDDDMRERSRFDQLAVIARVLGDPTDGEVSWCDPTALADIKSVCESKTFSTLGEAERKAQLNQRLIDNCQAVEHQPERLALLRALLEIDPAARPGAAAALKSSFFEGLVPAEQPVITPTPDAGRIEAAFAFEDENLPANELRILLANDLFRMAHEEEEEAAQGGVATPPVSI